MNRINRKIKKHNGGFTLVEIIAVLAIIAILFTVFTPKVLGYVNQAKKTKALSEVREVVLAVDTFNINAATPIGMMNTFADISSLVGNKYVDCAKIKSITGGMTYSSMKELLEGNKQFELNNNGEISVTT